MRRREQFLKAGLELMGLSYGWGFKGFDFEPYAGRDCSGFVTERLHFCGAEDWRATHNAQRLFAELPQELGTPLPGDLCFYGQLDGPVWHVMVVLGVGQLVYGAAGGDHTTTSQAEALKRGARVQLWPSKDLMGGFCGYRRIPWLDGGST